MYLSMRCRREKDFSGKKKHQIFDLYLYHLHGRSIQRSEVLLSLVSKRDIKCTKLKDYPAEMKENKDSASIR